MAIITLDQAIKTVMELPQEQQEMLLEIIRRRHIESRRREIANDAATSLEAYRSGEYKIETADAIIEELRSKYLEEME